jgi:hypothetical protein
LAPECLDGNCFLPDGVFGMTQSMTSNTAMPNQIMAAIGP